MKKFVVLTILFIFVLAACAREPSQDIETQGVPVTGPEEREALAVESTLTIPATEPSTGDLATQLLSEDREPSDGTGGKVVIYSLVPDESSITYEVGETFLDRGNVFNLAVGTARGVMGDLELNFDRPQDSRIGTLAVDISGLTSDNRRRDNAIRERFLQSARYPMVTFTPTEIFGIPEVGEPGVEYALTVNGDLTIRDVTQPAVFDAVVSWQEDVLQGQAVTTFLMSSYGFGPIEIFGILATEDEVKVTVDFTGKPK